MRTFRRGARRSVAIAAGAVLATSVLAACGSDDSNDDDASGDGSSSAEESAGALDDLSAEEIYDLALEETSDASSVHLDGEIDSEGQVIEMDLTLGTDSCDGTMTIGGVGIDLLGVDGEYWFRGDEAFWSAQSDGTPEDEQFVALVSDLWVPDTEGQFSEFCNIDSFFGDQDDADRPTDFAKGDTVDVDGTEALEVSWVTSDGSEVTAAVSAEEPHYYLTLTQDESGVVEFSDFGEDLDVQPPADDELLDPALLG